MALSLDGIDTSSDEAARALAQRQKMWSLYLGDGVRISPDALAALRANANIDLKTLQNK